jgi:hypothetical protein
MLGDATDDAAVAQNLCAGDGALKPILLALDESREASPALVSSCTNVVMNLSAYEACHSALIETDAVTLLRPLLDESVSTARGDREDTGKAAIALANLVGTREEAASQPGNGTSPLSPIKKLSSRRAEFAGVRRAVTMLRRRVERPHNDIGGVAYRLEFLVQAVANLCLSESNRQTLVEEGIVDLLTAVLAGDEERPVAHDLAASALDSNSLTNTSTGELSAEEQQIRSQLLDPELGLVPVLQKVVDEGSTTWAQAEKTRDSETGEWIVDASMDCWRALLRSARGTLSQLGADDAESAVLPTAVVDATALEHVVVSCKLRVRTLVVCWLLQRCRTFCVCVGFVPSACDGGCETDR